MPDNRAAVRPSVVILCGGRGTRLQEHTPSIPKPMVEIGGRPILWHVIQIYLAQGFAASCCSPGYRGEQIERFVARRPWPGGSRDPLSATRGRTRRPGGRLHLAAGELRGRHVLPHLRRRGGRHRPRRAARRPRRARRGGDDDGRPAASCPFGVAELDGDGVVRGFVEKPAVEHWVNGGFFCLEPAVLELLAPDSVLEREPLEQLAARGRAARLPPRGFWDCMDTYKDAVVAQRPVGARTAPRGSCGSGRERVAGARCSSPAPTACSAPG